MSGPAERMREVVALVAPMLRERGFRKGMTEVALPWLDRLRTADAVIAAWHAADPTVRPYATRPIVVALHHLRGDNHGAAEVIRAELRGSDHAGRARNFVDWAQELGLEVSMDDATIVRMLESDR